MDSHVVKHSRCPKCDELGKDKSGDNLAEYSDGHCYCFSCGYYASANNIESFLSAEKGSVTHEHRVYLPSDCSIDYPDRAIHWIERYGLTKFDLLNHNVMWSDSAQRLIFPVYGDRGLIAWQGRSFHLGSMAIAKVAKWYGKGNLKDTFNILGKGDKLVLTEDIVSAIKVSKCGYQAMPLYGCVVGRERFKRLYNLFGDKTDILLWLDNDKFKESVVESKLGRVCGLRCGVVNSKLDPKEVSVEEIKKLLT